MKKKKLQEVDMDLSSTKHSPSIFSLDVAICPKEKREKGWKHVKKRKKNDDAEDVPIGTLFPILPGFAI